MANAVYDSAYEGFGQGEIDWVNDTIRVALCDASYAADLGADRYVSDLGASIQVRSDPLTGKSIAAGVADAADILLADAAGDTVTQYVIFQDLGNDALSRLICRIDSATGLPLPLNGSSVRVVFDNGPNRIFVL